MPAPDASGALRFSTADIVIRLALDGSMVVHETLTTRADGTHAPPWRDIVDRAIPDPVRQPPVEIDVMHVAHGRQLLPWWGEPFSDGLRIHLGGAGRKLPAGERTYELLYHVDGQLAVDGDREMLLWRPLGRGLSWSVDQLTVAVTFPRHPAERDLSVQATGAGDSPVVHQVDDDGTVRLGWRDTIPAGREVALLLSWPRGLLLTDSDSETAHWMRPRQTALWWAIAGLPAAAALLWRARRAARRSVSVALAFAGSALSLGSLYLAGAATSLDSGVFRLGFSVAAFAAAFAWLARGWLLATRARAVYLFVVVASVTAAGAALTTATSAWYALLWLAHADLMLLAAWRFSLRGEDSETASPASPASLGASSREVRARRSPGQRRAPVLDAMPEFDDGWPRPNDGRGGRQSSSGC